jgi:hypothetical protein
MFGRQSAAVLCDDLKTWFAGDKEDETGRFVFGFGFA